MMKRFTRPEGQTLVEFALVLPVFMLIVIGILDAGRAVYTNSTLSQAAREGARLAAVEAGCVGIAPLPPGVVREPTGDLGKQVCPLDLARFKVHVNDAVERMTVSVGPVASVHVSCNAGTTDDPVPGGDWTEASGGNGCDDGSGASVGAAGDLVSVRIEHVYQPITPVIGSLFGSITLSGSASMVIN